MADHGSEASLHETEGKSTLETSIIGPSKSESEYLESKDAATVKQKLDEQRIKHNEELYWVRLELDTSRHEKEGLEERVAFIHKEVAAIQESKPERPLGGITPAYVLKLQHQLEKYERIIRVLTNQADMLRNSSDAVVRNLKDEISDLVDEKCKVEMSLMNQVARLEATIQGARVPVNTSQEVPTVVEDEEDVRARMIRLAVENAKLKKKLEAESFKLKRAETDKLELQERIVETEENAQVLRASSERSEPTEVSTPSREEMEEYLERTQNILDETKLNNTSCMDVLKKLKTINDCNDDDREALLSTLDLTVLVHREIKTSLIYIESNFQNRLNGTDAANKSHQSTLGSSVTKEEFAEIQKDVVTAIQRVEQSITEKIKVVEERSLAANEEKGSLIKSSMIKLLDLQDKHGQLATRCHSLEAVQKETDEKSKDTALVSQPIMEQLQNEVLQVVKLIQEKNKTINSLKDQHKKLVRKLKKVKKGGSGRDQTTIANNEDASKENSVN